MFASQNANISAEHTCWRLETFEKDRWKSSLSFESVLQYELGSCSLSRFFINEFVPDGVKGCSSSPEKGFVVTWCRATLLYVFVWTQSIFD